MSKKQVPLRKVREKLEPHLRNIALTADSISILNQALVDAANIIEDYQDLVVKMNDILARDISGSEQANHIKELLKTRQFLLKI
jgi:5'(3')-deoxyribonucleotidase